MPLESDVPVSHVQRRTHGTTLACHGRQWMDAAHDALPSGPRTSPTGFATELTSGLLNATNSPIKSTLAVQGRRDRAWVTAR